MLKCAVLLYKANGELAASKQARAHTHTHTYTHTASLREQGEPTPVWQGGEALLSNSIITLSSLARRLEAQTAAVPYSSTPPLRSPGLLPLPWPVSAPQD